MDKLLHLFGGIGAAVIVLAILKHYIKKEVQPLAMTVFGLVCFLIIIWEVLEFFVIPIFTYKDTVFDMMFGMTGALIWVIGHWLSKR